MQVKGIGKKENREKAVFISLFTSYWLPGVGLQKKEFLKLYST